MVTRVTRGCAWPTLGASEFIHPWSETFTSLSGRWVLTTPHSQEFFQSRPSDVPSSEEKEWPVFLGIGCLELIPQPELPFILQLQADHGLAE